ncbi:MAG TPA: hypothetical protein PKE69_16360 [Pyrinomonadaceae bacterium]|nr:hypothetical protein [Pyrinomonadaceae bacterium]
MNDAHRRRMDKIDRERVFITDNAVDFPKDSPVDIVSGNINAKATDTLARDADLAAAFGGKAQAMSIKGDRRDNLLEAFREIVLGAKAIGNSAVPGITARFKMPEPRTEQNLLATADAFFTDTAALEQQFIDVGLDADFRTALITAKNNFQTARDEADSEAEEHGEAVGALDALMREMMQLSRQRSAMVKLKYKNNPGKLAAWAIASHLESAPKKPATP